MLVPQAIYTDPTQQGLGYKLAASSPGLSPVDLAYLTQFPRESPCLTNLQSPCTDATTYKSFFELPSKNYALTQQFRSGGICRGCYRVVVHSIVLSPEVLDSYHWNLELILTECNFTSIMPVSIPYCNGTFVQLQQQIGQYAIHHLPDLNINCADEIIHNYEQQLYTQLKAMLGNSTQQPQFAGALQQVFLQKKPIRFPQVEQDKMLLVWSLLPIADRKQIFWMTGYDHNQIVKNAIDKKMQFSLVSTDDHIDGFVNWQKLPITVANTALEVITGFMGQLKGLQKKEDLYALLKDDKNSLLNNYQIQQRLTAFYTEGCKDLKDLTELLSLLKNSCFADNTAEPWFDKEQVFRGVCLTALNLYAADQNFLQPIKDVLTILNQCEFINLLPLPNELPQFFKKHSTESPESPKTTVIAIAMVFMWGQDHMVFMWGQDHDVYPAIELLKNLHQMNSTSLKKSINSLRRHLLSNLIFIMLDKVSVSIIKWAKEDHELLNSLISQHRETDTINDTRGHALWQLADNNDEAQGLLLDCRSQHSADCHREFASKYYMQRIKDKPTELLSIIKDFFARKTNHPDLDIGIMYEVISYLDQKPNNLFQTSIKKLLQYKKYTLLILQVEPTAKINDIQDKVRSTLFSICVDNYLKDIDIDFQANIMLLVQPSIRSRLLDQDKREALLTKLHKNKEVVLADALERIFNSLR